MGFKNSTDVQPDDSNDTPIPNTLKSLYQQYQLKRQVKVKPARFKQIANRRIPDSAVRPEIFGESYNAKIRSKSTSENRLTIDPLWHFHSIALILAVPLIFILAMTSLVDPVNPFDPEFSTLAPENSILFFFATIPPGFVPFVLFFGLTGLALMLRGLCKPLRKVTFERVNNQCTIERVWLFGLFKRLRQTVTISDITALQVTSYTDKQAATRYFQQTGKQRGSSGETSVKEYELNLVQEDGTRINLINHRYKRGVQRDSTTLCQWLKTAVIGEI